MVHFFFFFPKTRTHTSACKPFYAALSLETSEETEHSLREYGKQRREIKTKKNCKVMVITCAIVCIHNVCVFVCVKGDNIAVSRERP